MLYINGEISGITAAIHHGEHWAGLPDLHVLEEV